MQETNLAGSGTFEIVRSRLDREIESLRGGLAELDKHRRDVFGSVGFSLLQGDKITTPHLCVPQDMTDIGQGRFLFGFQVLFGLINEITPRDVFAIYRRNEETGTFHQDEEAERGILDDPQFLENFRRIYRVYEKVVFVKFSEVPGSVFMVFRTGNAEGDFSVFQWKVTAAGWEFSDGRAESEFRSKAALPRYNFAWRVPDRDQFRYGEYPHISIEDRVFVDCIGGHLTFKIEDNTNTGEGIFSEPVEDPRQKIDDAEVAFAVLGPLVLLRIRPYKESATRYFIYNEKLTRVERVDSLGESCAALPEDQGLVFPDGYYLTTGDLKLFGKSAGHRFERLIASPNGEDFLYVFYSAEQREYILLPYRLIEQKVSERIACHGFCIFPDGQALLIRAAGTDPQKHHSIQLRQTPFFDASHEPPGRKDEFLYGVGNRDVVRCLAAIQEIIALCRKDDPYSELYADVVRRCGDLLDAYPWLGRLEPGQGGGLREFLERVRQAADQAVDEFDKVLRLRREATEKASAFENEVREVCAELPRAVFKSVADFAGRLTRLRTLAGQAAALRELPYAETHRLDGQSQLLREESAGLATRCVAFLADPASLAPYQVRADELLSRARAVKKTADANEVDLRIAETSNELETLVETINALPLDDPTETTRILDAITGVHTILNQARGELRNRKRNLGEEEARAKFAAAMRLLAQSTQSRLDLADSPEKCDDALARLGLQLQEMEAAFADYEEFIAEILVQREEISSAFEQRKTSLLEARAKQAGAVHTAAGRLLALIENRLASLDSPAAISAFLASDSLAEKIRSSIRQLFELGDSLKADDLSSRLKSLGQQAARQLQDRQELFADGGKVIQVGRHRFNVNTQALDVTIVERDESLCLHLTGTSYFERLHDPDLDATRAVWKRSTVSENEGVYRGEFLAWKFLQSQEDSLLASWAAKPLEEITQAIASFMANRYEEAYSRGIHDADAALIFQAHAKISSGLGLAGLSPDARAMARVYKSAFLRPSDRPLVEQLLGAVPEQQQAFPGEPLSDHTREKLTELLEQFADEAGLFSVDLAATAASYLMAESVAPGSPPQTPEAEALQVLLQSRLEKLGKARALEDRRQAMREHPAAWWNLLLEWLEPGAKAKSGLEPFLAEAAAGLFCQDTPATCAVPARREIVGLKGAHPRVQNGAYGFDFHDYVRRMTEFERVDVPLFRRLQTAKHRLLEDARAWMKLESFRPQVLNSFVRNRLIDEVYLPLIGDNLAKQMGAAGAEVRTDRSGLLLLVSPPGYGKTTLLEYLASRLGLQFVKINGPALGEETRSLDPAAAPHGAARREIERLNFALEMGDNILLCIDDIQHCHEEFLQRFISLCDAQRKIEGMWRGEARNYDLRGRKVVVAMAGNPYTGSGSKFKIPDMLANRADTYNLGDLVDGNAGAFRASYIENAATSNSVLAPVAQKSTKDLRTFLDLAENGENAAPEGRFEAAYSQPEASEILQTMRHLLAVRDAVLAVNLQYIASAAQSDEFRTEPAFKLQGSYRNMNRLADKVLPALTKDEVRSLLLDHYRNESQTLTADTEANLLKLKELFGWLSKDELARWEEIKRVFQRNQVRGKDDDPASRIAGQIGLLGETFSQTRGEFAGHLRNLGQQLAESMQKPASTQAEETPRLRNIEHELEMVHTTLAAVQDLAIQQRDALEKARGELAQRAKQGVLEIDLTDEMLANQQKFLDHFQNLLRQRKEDKNES